MLTSATDTTSGGSSRREDDIAFFARFVWRQSTVYPHLSVSSRLVADTLEDNVAELREDEQARTSQYADSEHSRNRALTCCYRLTSALQAENLAFKVVRERNNRLASGHVGDLHSPMLRVSVPASHAPY